MHFNAWLPGGQKKSLPAQDTQVEPPKQPFYIFK